MVCFVSSMKAVLVRHKIEDVKEWYIGRNWGDGGGIYS